ncbi:Synaptotagmin-like protein 2 Exophilin-4 [Channa argus]|uniref:Synaptotagmin-like protein 2 Exophilin-4 n=1 Tax=Channa argus TaxID=215402 RepID=A0A6G1QX65_CHAAH|nr:Synaptotagmin-like protein 2 Exophilin-4 [Channa argus]
MIDLSFLSEEEQETILAVLKRDAELKKFEEHRIQNLQKSVKDKSQLRYLTGEWFYEAKQVRHQDRIHGSDIIRASMRHTHKPLTILELSQMLPEKSSFISNENKEVFIPPVLRGLLQEPRMQPRIKKYQNQNPDETPQDASKPVSHSPVKFLSACMYLLLKQRKNPFNSEFSACHTVKEKNSQVVDGAVSETRTLNEEPLPPSETCSSYVSNIRQNCNDSSANLNPSAVSSSSQDCFVEVDWSGCRQTDADVPQGILNNLPTDSLFCQLDLQSLSSLDSPTETWVDPKQARFSSTIGQRRVEWHDGKELGEHSLLDTDSTAPSEMENNHLNNGNTTASTQRSLFNHSQTASQEGELKNEARLQEQDVVKHQAFGDVSEQSHSELICPSVSSLMSAEESGKHVHLEMKHEEEHCSQAKATRGATGHSVNKEKLPEQSTNNSFQTTSDTQPSTSGSSSSPHADPTFFSSDRSAEVQRPQNKAVKIPKRTETDKSQTLYQSTSNMTVDTSAFIKHETKLSTMTNVKTVQLTARQNSEFKETVYTVHEEATEGRVVQPLEKLSNLRAFWERENTGPKIIFAKGEARQEATAKEGTKASHVPQMYMESKHYLPMKMEKNEVQDITHKSQKKTLSLRTEGSLSVDWSTEDGTYRANPVLIYEETEDSLKVSVKETQIPGPHENIINSLAHSVGFNTHKQVGDIPVSLPRQSTSIPQEDRPAKISELKHFWEMEYTGPRVIVARVKEHSSMLGDKEVSPQSDPRESEGEEQTSLNRTKSSGILKALKVTDKGFVSLNPDRSQLRCVSSTGDIPAAWSQNQVKAETQFEERPLSPSQPHRPASKNQNDKVRKSPPKTCHPKVLPKEFSSPERSSLEGSPLKTFPIDINPQTEVVRQQEGKPTTVPKQSPLHKAKQTGTKPSMDVRSSPLPLHLKDTGTYIDHVNTEQSSTSSSTSLQSKKASEHRFRTFTHLARSFLPQDYQYYLGPKENAHSPPSNHEKASATENDEIHEPQCALRDFVGNQSESHNEWSTTSSCAVSKHRNPSQDTTTRPWTLSRASANNCSDFEIQGSIQFAVNYIQKLGEFHIFVVHCKDLAMADTKKSRCDPYVKCYLLPDKSKLGKRKTTVKKKTLNPTYNEILKFTIKMEELKTQNLNISVWHNDTLGRNSFLGEVDLDLSEWDFSNTQINEHRLKTRLHSSGVSTNLNTISLASDGQQGTDESCSEIPAKDVSHTVLPDTSRKSRQKTRVVKRTANPMFNHTMVYDGFQQEDLREACVELTVWDHDRLNNHYIGGLRLGLGTDLARVVGLLEEYCTKLRKPEEQQLKTAIQRVMGIFKSNLFEALLAFAALNVRTPLLSAASERSASTGRLRSSPTTRAGETLGGAFPQTPVADNSQLLYSRFSSGEQLVKNIFQRDQSSSDPNGMQQGEGCAKISENRPAAVQGSTPNSQAPPCMNPALMNAPWQYHYQEDDSPPLDHGFPRLTNEVRAPELVHVSEKNLSEIENVHGYVSHSHISPLKRGCKPDNIFLLKYRAYKQYEPPPMGKGWFVVHPN